MVKDVLLLQSCNSPVIFVTELTFQKLCFCPQNFPLAAVTEQRCYRERQRGYTESTQYTTVDQSGLFCQLYSSVPKQSFQTANLILTQYQHTSYSFQLNRESANQNVPLGDTVHVSVHFHKAGQKYLNDITETHGAWSVFSRVTRKRLPRPVALSALVFDWQRGTPSVH